MLSTVKSRVLYACGDTGLNAMNAFCNTFLLVFMTDILGLNPFAAGTMFLVARVWDAVNDPMMGMLADRTRTRWGRYRPYLLFAVVPLCAVFVLMYTVPGFKSEGAKLVWAYCIYILYGMLNTAMNIPYGALPGVLTTDPHERTLLSVFRTYGSNIGSMLISVFAATILLRFSESTEVPDASGYQAGALIYAAFMLIMFLCTFLGTKETVELPKRRGAGLKESLQSVAHNKPALILILISFFNMMGVATRLTMMTYYVMYYLQDFSAVTLLLTTSSVCSLTLPIFTPYVTKRVGKRGCFILGGFANILCGIVTFIAGRNLVLCCLAMVCFSCVSALTTPTLLSSAPDAADYGEWKTGVWCPGVIASGTSFGLKLASGLGSFVIGIVLSLTGYDGDAFVQSETTQNAIYILFACIPIVFGTLMAVTATQFDLTPETMDNVSAELKARRARQIAEQDEEQDTEPTTKS